MATAGGGGGSAGGAMQSTEIYMERMMKLQMKLTEVGTFKYMPVFIPQQFIDIGWGDQTTDCVALFGNQLRTGACLDKPNCVFEATAGHFYTIICFDGDASPAADGSSAPGCYLHWIRHNITGDTRYASGKDSVRWQAPHPAENSNADPHRYFFLVYHQTKGEIPADGFPKIVSKNSKEGRSNFDLAALVKRLNLGHVIGANCCRLAYDASVEKTVADLRDIVEFSADGKKVVAEVLNGVRTEFGKKKDSTGAAPAGSTTAADDASKKV